MINKKLVYKNDSKSNKYHFEIKEIELPEIGEHDVLVKLQAVSLNYRDILFLEDVKRSSDNEFVAGSDGAGSVVEVGRKVSCFKQKDRVVVSFFLKWESGSWKYKYRDSALGGDKTEGLLKQYVVVPESSLVKLPERFSFEEGACFPCAGVTAWNSLITRGRINKDSVILIQGTGGVSMFALQIAKTINAKTIVLSGSKLKEAIAAGIGATYTINYKDCPNWEEKVLEITGGDGVTHILEVIGNKNLEKSIKCLADFGCIAYVGCLSGVDNSDFDPMPLLYKNARFEGIYVGSRDNLQEVISYFDSRGVNPLISKVFNSDQLEQAMEYLKSKMHVGKIVVRIDV